MASLKPLHDRVVVERNTSEEMTAGGIVLPETAKDKPKQGKVIAVGTGKQLDNGDVHKLEVAKGDEVLFSSFAGTEVKVDGTEYLVLNEHEILAVIENGKKKKKK